MDSLPDEITSAHFAQFRNRKKMGPISGNEGEHKKNAASILSLNASAI
jgi:hypothetical protein